MVIRRNRFLQYIDAIARRRVVTIGPAVAEVDVLCAATRLAPDRCMPVYAVEESSIHPGGAALTAATVSGLGGAATLIAPVGRGRPGMALRRVLEEHRVSLVECGEEGVRTPELFRYVTPGAGRQLLQMRRGWHNGRFVDLRGALDRAARGTAHGGGVDAICLVDGLPAAISDDDLRLVVEWAEHHDVPVIFDAAGAGLIPALLAERRNDTPTTNRLPRSAGAKAGNGRLEVSRSALHFVLNDSESLLIAQRLGYDEAASTDLSGADRNASPGSHADPLEDRVRWLATRLDAVIVLTLGPRGALVAMPRDRAAPADLESADLVIPDARSRGSAAATVADAADGTRHAPGIESAPAVVVARVPTNPLPMSDRRGVGFVFSGVYALMVAVGAPPIEAAFLASGAATAAAAQPGPKRVTMDGLVKIAYREIEAHVADGIEVFDRIARDHLPVIDRAARLLLDAYNEGRQVLVFGNGGSAAEANHLAGELTGRFRQSRPGLPAISLSANDSIATCIANDYGYDEVFSRQIDTFCRPGDVVIGLTTSGRSPNVVKAMARARELGARTIALVGADPGPLGAHAEVAVAVPSRSTGRIQEAHLFVIHVMCDMLDRRLDALGRLQPAASEI